MAFYCVVVFAAVVIIVVITSVVIFFANAIARCVSILNDTTR